MSLALPFRDQHHQLLGRKAMQILSHDTLGITHLRLAYGMRCLLKTDDVCRTLE